MRWGMMPPAALPAPTQPQVAPPAMPPAAMQAMPPEAEVAYLEEQKKALEAALKEISKRISELKGK